MEIIEYSKIDMATFLKNFHEMMMIATLKPHNSFKNIFHWNMQRKKMKQYSSNEYYNEMINVYEIQLTSKYLTILFDNYFDFLLESEIDFFDIPETIFVNPKDFSSFSKRQIIKFIRNAFNHNDNEQHILFKYIRVIKNGISAPMIEIYLRNTKPIPFHIRLSIFDLCSIINEITKSNTINIISLRSKKNININSSNFNNELNNMFYRKFYSRKKLDKDKLKELLLFTNMGKKTKNYEELLSGLGLEYKDFYFNAAQKIKIAEDLVYWENRGVIGNDIIEHLAAKVMPFSFMRERLSLISIILTDYYINDGNYSLSDFVSEAKKIYYSGTYDENSPLKLYVNFFGLDRNILFDCLDYDNLISMTSSIYYGYIFDTLVTDSMIKIAENRDIPRNRIRNSFVHMRWFKGIKECFKLYDWGNGMNDEFNKDSPTFWSTNIKLLDMQNCVENYFEKALNNQKENHSINFRIGFNYDEENGKILNGIRFLKSGVLYFMLLNPLKYDNCFKLYIIDDRQVEMLANNEQKQLFLKELDNLTEKEKCIYSRIIEQIKMELINSRGFIEEKDKIRK